MPIILFFLVLILVLPIYLRVNLAFYFDNSEMKFMKIKDKKNYIGINILKYLNVYKYNIDEKILSKGNNDIIDIIAKKYDSYKTKKEGIKKQDKKIKKFIFDVINSFYVDKLYLSIGVNTSDTIYNSYINAVINASLLMFINTNQEKFNIKNLYYNSYVSEHFINIETKSTIKTNIYKLLIKYIKRTTKTKKVKLKIKKAGMF